MVTTAPTPAVTEPKLEKNICEDFGAPSRAALPHLKLLNPTKQFSHSLAHG
jgi:hypothetical protein